MKNVTHSYLSVCDSDFLHGQKISILLQLAKGRSTKNNQKFHQSIKAVNSIGKTDFF